MADKPSLARGTRDFGPAEMAKRTFLIETIKSVFKKYGFLQLETPSFENLSVLTGKYGAEGDQLIFKILNSGDYFNNVPQELINKEGAKKLLPHISEKALRYDLTVPFARFVAMNRNDIQFPFKRFQVQPVWRADRPQKGRYREFYQCDADVVGTDSLICEAEILAMLNEGLQNLGFEHFLILVNNRKILSGIAEAIGNAGQESSMCVAIDKLDKIGIDGVSKELLQFNFSQAAIDQLMGIINIKGNNAEKIAQLKNVLAKSEIGLKGVNELEETLALHKSSNLGGEHNIEINISLARGLSYYTGAIFEVKATNIQMGSICGGGRYDNLTGVFGLPNVSGVGISFGIDRIYDCMNELNLFPENIVNSADILVVNFSEELTHQNFAIACQLRKNKINIEFYPEAAKLKKQFAYADAKKINYVLVAGLDEINSGKFSIKNMITGGQEMMTIEEIISKFIKK